MSVEYPPDVMDEIRLEVLEAFYAFPRGGAEVGGVLFGSHADGRVSIAAKRPLTCEHATGPSFVLSENDHERLAALLHSPETDPELGGLRPVGWYHSHTRSDIFLSPQDVEVHERYFREPWQVALVLRPSLAGTRADFFGRDAEGRLKVKPGEREIELRPLSGRVLARPRPQPDPLPPVKGEPETSPDRPLEVPAFLLAPPPQPHRRRGWLKVAALVAVSAAAAVVTRGYWLPYIAGAFSGSPALQARDKGGQLYITWNPTARKVANARGGMLKITEGAGTSVTMLDAQRLRAGSYTYARRSDRVDVRLKLDQSDGEAVEEFAGFIGAPAAPRGAANLSEAELRAEYEKLQAELLETRTQLLNQALLIRRLRAAKGEPVDSPDEGEAAGPAK